MIGRPSLRSLAGDTRGAVHVEYLAVLTFVGMVAAFAVYRVAPQVIHGYAMQRQMLYQPLP